MAAGMRPRGRKPCGQCGPVSRTALVERPAAECLRGPVCSCFYNPASLKKASYHGKAEFRGCKWGLFERTSRRQSADRGHWGSPVCRRRLQGSSDPSREGRPPETGTGLRVQFDARPELRE